MGELDRSLCVVLLLTGYLYTLLLLQNCTKKMFFANTAALHILARGRAPAVESPTKT